MINFRATLIFTLAGILLLGAGLTSCHSGEESSPAGELQSLLASHLADPEVCPSGEGSEVQAILFAATPGSVVHLPQGCYRVKSTIDLPACNSLVGDGADKTILYRETGGYDMQPILRLRGKPGESCTTQISGLALLGVRDTEDTGEDYGLLISNVHDFRLDHAYFEGFGFAGVRVEGNSRGVIDHTIFLDNFKRGIDNLGYGVAVYGYTWEADPQVGGAEAVFVEDSLFSGNRHAIAASSGAHYVFRHNQVLQGVEACAVDAHGMGFGNQHGTRYVEIYRNQISDPVYNWCGIGIRGGAGVIFENDIQSYENTILLILEWGTSDRLNKQYPALDQVQELYIWDNYSSRGPIQPQVDETGEGFIEAGRDYFTGEKPGYAPYIYPHPLAGGGPFDAAPWPPVISP